MEINNKVHAYKDDIVEFLREMIRIPSLEEEAQPGAPFGQPCHDALTHALEHARALGFANTKDVDGYAGYIEIGEGERELGVIAHLDVVPVGRGWTKQPFGAEVADGRIYGRGAMDDKGGVAASLYAMKVLSDIGAELKVRVRLILGCNEETGMKCMDYYGKAETMPDYAFSPDAEYPVINMEKGILQVQFNKACPPTADGLRVVSASAGERPNVVPGEAELCLAGGNMDEIRGALSGCSATLQLEQRGDIIAITALGNSAHGSTPDKGDNAIWMLCEALNRLPLADGEVEQALKAMAAKVGDNHDGSKMDLAISDESGRLTCNLGILRADDSGVSFTLDIRHPVTYEHEYVLERLDAAFAPAGYNMQLLSEAPNHCVPTDHPLVKTLLDVYKEQTGNEGQPIAIGGGTYARVLPNRAVAFGMQFPGAQDVAHQPDEFINIDELIKNTEIIAHAIYKLACTDVLFEG